MALTVTGAADEVSAGLCKPEKRFNEAGHVQVSVSDNRGLGCAGCAFFAVHHAPEVGEDATVVNGRRVLDLPDEVADGLPE